MRLVATWVLPTPNLEFIQGVSANTVNYADGWGGAIFNAFGSHAVIDQNLFSGNSASGANADGGAIYNQGDLIIKASSFFRKSEWRKWRGVRQSQSSQQHYGNSSKYYFQRQQRH